MNNDEKKIIRTPRGRILILLAYGGVIVAFYVLYGHQWLNLDILQQHKSTLLEYVHENYWLLYLASGIFYALAAALSLPGMVVITMVLGFMFGRLMGTLLIVVSATIGATLLFLMVRYFFADWVRERLLSNESATTILEGFQSDAFNYLLFLRLVPVFPFWLVNLVPAFTNISGNTYILATCIGIVPGSFVFANLGQSLGKIDHYGNLLSTEMLLALSLLGLLALVPVLVRRMLKQLSHD